MDANLTKGQLIREVYPSLNEPDYYVFVLTALFLIFFIVGVCGNVATLCLLFGLAKPYNLSRKQNHETALKWSDGNDRVKFYLAALCIIDVFMLLGLPSAIVDSLIGFWIFNTYFCKFHHFCNAVGRIAPAYVMIAMSIDAHWKVKNVIPQKLEVKYNKAISSIMISLALISFLFLLPILAYAKAQKIFLFESNRQDGSILHVRIFKCVDGMPIRVLFWVTGSTFLFGYFLPAIFISITNAKSIINMRKNQVHLPSRNVKALKQITTYIVMISVFYLVSWLPYWCSVLYVSYVDLFESRIIKNLTDGSEPAIVLLCFAHLFPYFYAAANWLLYSRMGGTTNSATSKEYLTSTAAEAGILSTILAEEPNDGWNDQSNLHYGKNDSHTTSHNANEKVRKICNNYNEQCIGNEVQKQEIIFLLSADALLLNNVEATILI